MKMFFFILLMLFSLVSCKEDLSDYENRIEQQQAANAKLQGLVTSLTEQNDELAKRNADVAAMLARVKLEGDELAYKLDSLEQYLSIPADPKILSMEFVTKDNKALTNNITCEIIGDSIIDCWLPSKMQDKFLIPRFVFDGTLVTIDEQEAVSGKTMFDFSKPVMVMVHTSMKSTSYTMYVHAYTGLPVLYLTTNGRRAITSKNYYLKAQFRLVEDVKTRAPGDVVSVPVEVKGRGNSSWKLPKKAYRLKFPEKISLFGEHKDKSWVLVPNYPDKSMVRNRTATFMSSISLLDYTPKSHFVELILNGKYNGTYELYEKIKISNHRVAVGDDGFLVEIDMRAENEGDSRIFRTTFLENCVNIKEPAVEYGDANYVFIKNYFYLAEEALFSSNFKDPNIGWQKYIDMDSFVDWYLINEISKNIDGLFFTSCYMNLQRGGKLKMGPVWDYDVAFGNINQNNQTCNLTSGFYIKSIRWYTRLFQDPAFVARVKERFNYFYDHKNDIMNEINADGQYLRFAAEENNKVWGTLYNWTWTNYDIWGAYQNEVQSLKDWLDKRMNWLKGRFDTM